MKEYLKPTCDEIELRQEENVASSSNNCNTTWVGNDSNGWGTGDKDPCYKTQGS